MQTDAEQKLAELLELGPLRNEEYSKPRVWLSCDLRLDDFSIKKESFSITGWIDAFWKWPKAPKKLHTFDRMDSFESLDVDVKDTADDKPDPCRPTQAKLMYVYTNDEGQRIVHIADLRQSSLSYYLPIDANKILFQPSLIKITHIEAPKLSYNQSTKMAHSEYYVTAELNECLELFYFPFDSQFLNLKIRFNVDYFCILDYIDEKKYPLQHNFWGNKGSKTSNRGIEQHHDKPIKIGLKESLMNEVVLFPVWCDFRSKKEFNGRYSMIRLRVARNPLFVVTNVLFPFFIIVSCSFSAFVVSLDYDSLGDRFAVSVTILLTFTAFQTIIDKQLPETSVMLLLDYYILVAYLVQALIILETGIIAGLDDGMVDGATLGLADNVIGCVLGAIWCMFSAFYMLLQVRCVRKCHDKCCGCFESVGDWDKRSQRKMQSLAKSQEGVVTVVGYELCEDGKPKRVLTDPLDAKPGIVSRQHTAMAYQDNQ